MRRELGQIFAASIAAKRRFLRENARTLEQVVHLTADALKSGHKLLLFGNGGSAADAQHIAAEFINRFSLDRPPLAALALTTDSSALTSIANDCGYAGVFAKQIHALGSPGDVAIAISTSGNSPNVLRAVSRARRMGIRTVGLTGGTGGKLGARADYHLCVRGTSSTPRIQETHILIGHAICDLVERLLVANPASRSATRKTRSSASHRPRRQQPSR